MLYRQVLKFAVCIHMSINIIIMMSLHGSLLTADNFWKKIKIMLLFVFVPVIIAAAAALWLNGQCYGYVYVYPVGLSLHVV